MHIGGIICGAMEINDKALLDALASHLELTVMLAEDHMNLCRRTVGDYDPKLNDMLANTRATMQRIRALLSP